MGYGIAVALALAAPLAAGAQLEFASGAQQIGLLAGGGFGFPLIGGERHEVHETRSFALFPRWTIGLSDPLARGALYEGNIELGLEPMGVLNFSPRFGWTAGGALLLHYNFLAARERSRIVPFVEGSAGVGHLDFDLEGESDGFIFPLHGSIGLHVLGSAGAALTGSVGWYHLSNAGIRSPNYGINAVMIRIGITSSRPG
jgi:hypothetical protein